MQTIYGVTSGENIVQAFTEENTTEANFHQSINNAAILTFTTTEPLKAGVQFFLTKDPINDYKHEEFMYFEITDQDFDGYEYTYRAEEYAYHDLDTMGYVKKVYTQGKWTTRTLLESIVYKDVEPKGVARTKWEIIDNDLTLPTTWAGEGNTYTLWYNTPLRGIEKFIEYFGGEIRFYVTIFNNKISRHYLEIYEKRGRETGKRYESNSNLISLTNKAEYDNRYEYIIPLGEGGGTSGDEQKYNTPNGFNNYITLEGLEVGKSTDKWHKPKSQMYISLANDKKAYPLKSQPKGLQNNPRIKPVTFEDVKSKQALFNKAIEWLENNQGVAWSYSASVLDIGESQVGDTIAIIDERSGISSYVRVHDIDYDMIDPENTGVHFGNNWGYENDEAITDMLNTATAARHDTIALIDTAIRQSNGKNTNYYGKNEPADPTAGDLWYKQAGDETYLMIFKDGQWVELVSTRTQKVISDAVDEATSEANSYADSLNATQASEAAAFQSEANSALSEAAAERKVFSSNAASMASSAATHADSMADSAATYGKAQAASALSSANSALTTAKSDLTNGIASEASERQQAVQTVNSQAQTYANQAKSDAIAASKTADGVVRKDFKETTDSLTSTISQNKQDSDGKISTAQSTATQALDGLKTKVSQTDYNTKTGQLQTDLTATTQTANQAKLDIASIKSEADTQSAQINDIVSDAKGTKQTISDIKTEQGKQSGSIATLQSRADGFDATVTKVNNLSVGGRNYILNSKEWTQIYTNLDATATSEKDENGNTVVHVVIPENGRSGSGIYWFSKPIDKDKWLSLSADVKGTAPVIEAFNVEPSNDINKIVTFNSEFWTRISSYGVTVNDSTRANVFYFNPTRGAVDIYIRLPKLEFGTIATDWSPAPEDVSSATAKAQLTADKATLAINNYKTDADGRISKAQADITATSKEVKTKVSQSDFDKTTGDLTTKYGQVKATADAVTTDVAKYKKTNDGKVSANETSINTLNNQITSKVSQTDFDKKTGDLSGKFTETKQTVEKISNTVTELQAKANSQGQVNQLMNTEFSPDLQSWGISNPNNIATVYTSNGYQGSVGLRVNAYSYNNDDDQTYYKVEQTLNVPDFISSLSLKVRGYIYAISDNDYAYVNANIQAIDSSGNIISAIVPGTELFDKTKLGTWQESNSKFVGATVPEGTKEILISVYVRGRASISISQPMVVFDKVIGDYVPGNYNNNNRVAALELGIDHITGLVNDPKNGLSATAALAANGMVVATSAQNDATTAIQTAKGTQTTVSSVQKNIKDLQSTTTQTADQVTKEIQDRKNGDSASETLLKNLIEQRVNDVTTGYTGAIQTMANGIYASVSMPNKLVNTEFAPDLEGWKISNPLRGTGNPATIRTSNGYGSSNGLRIDAYTNNSDNADAYYYVQQIVKIPGNISVASLRVMGIIYAISNSGNAYVNANVAALDSAGKTIGAIVPGAELFNKNKTQTWQESSPTFINMAIPNGTDSLQISIYARGQTSVNISQPMLVFNSTVGNYQVGSYNNMGTSTVLELFKDNWALGIVDNSGKIISGINGDRSGTVIQGKKLVINSDTTINGKAFIDGSVIKNASIGTAQIGKAAVGSAQIINVDVSKISGNIANFITGNIKRLNSSVLYGNTGHLTTVDTGLIINNQDDHLQLSSKGQYDVPTKRAQFELLGYANNVDKNMRGSLNYYKNPHNKGTGLGIRFLGNQILAIDEAVSTGNLYLSPYASGQVQVVNRNRNGFQDIKASKFVTSSERKYKSEIEDFNDNALELVNNLNVRKYIKNNEDEIGVIADETDERILDKDNTGVDLYSFVSVLAKAVQELSEQVEELQKERPNDY